VVVGVVSGSRVVPTAVGSGIAVVIVVVVVVLVIDSESVDRAVTNTEVGDAPGASARFAFSANAVTDRVDSGSELMVVISGGRTACCISLDGALSATWSGSSRSCATRRAASRPVATPVTSGIVVSVVVVVVVMDSESGDEAVTDTDICDEFEISASFAVSGNVFVAVAVESGCELIIVVVVVVVSDSTVEAVAVTSAIVAFFVVMVAVLVTDSESKDGAGTKDS
jgi:hypothetical protein